MYVHQMCQLRFTCTVHTDNSSTLGVYVFTFPKFFSFICSILLIGSSIHNKIKDVMNADHIHYLNFDNTSNILNINQLIDLMLKEHLTISFKLSINSSHSKLCTDICHDNLAFFLFKSTLHI